MLDLDGPLSLALLVVGTIWCAGAGAFVWQRLVARDPPERLLATVLPTLVLVAILLLLEPVMSSTTLHWNDSRLAPSAALLHGYGL